MSWRKIWYILWRDHSVLSRERKRNKKRWWHYDAEYAWVRAKQRTYWKKKQCKKIRLCNELEGYVYQKLEQWRTAEAVAGRWNNIDRMKYWWEKELPTVLWISIRRYINSKYGSYLKYHLKQLKLLKKYKKKAKRGKREWWRIQWRVFINDRPQFIWTKTVRWHCEVDFIVSTQWDSTVLLVIVEKMTRYKRAIKLPSRDSVLVYKCLQKLIDNRGLKSMTFDNDVWFALHYQLSIPTYFCNTYSSWQKWQVERWNRWYRKFFPKKTELKNISQEDIDKASNYVNNYPLKCLGYLTPQEAYMNYEKTIWKIKWNLVVQ